MKLGPRHLLNAWCIKPILYAVRETQPLRYTGVKLWHTLSESRTKCPMHNDTQTLLPCTCLRNMESVSIYHTGAWFWRLLVHSAEPEFSQRGWHPLKL